MKRCALSLALAAALSLACSGDDISDDAVPAADASTNPDSSGLPIPSQALAVGGDYGGNGVAARIDVDALEVETNAVAGVVGGDPVLRRHGPRLYVIDRTAGSVTVLDLELQLVAQIATGAVNPQDVAIDGDTIYVAALDAPGVLVLDVSRPDAGVVETLDLSSLDEEDGVPDCNSVRVVGDRLYVTCGIIERKPFPEPWVYRSPGVVAVLDTADGSLVTSFELSHENPFGRLVETDVGGPYGGDLLVSTVPDPFGDVTLGCLERIGTGDAPAAKGCVAEHADLGGYAAAYAEADGPIWAAITTGAGGRVAMYDGREWTDGSLLLDGANPIDVVACPDGDVLVADAAAASRGVHVFDKAGNPRTDAPLDVGWPEVFFPSNALACW